MSSRVGKCSPWQHHPRPRFSLTSLSVVPWACFLCPQTSCLDGYKMAAAAPGYPIHTRKVPQQKMTSPSLCFFLKGRKSFSWSLQQTFLMCMGHNSLLKSHCSEQCDCCSWFRLIRIYLSHTGWGRTPDKTKATISQRKTRKKQRKKKRERKRRSSARWIRF